MPLDSHRAADRTVRPDPAETARTAGRRTRHRWPVTWRRRPRRLPRWVGVDRQSRGK